MKIFPLYGLQKTVFMCFPGNVGRHFCPDFQGFCPDVRESKLLGVRWNPLYPPPTPLGENRNRLATTGWQPGNCHPTKIFWAQQHVTTILPSQKYQLVAEPDRNKDRLKN